MRRGTVPLQGEDPVAADRRTLQLLRRVASRVR